MRFTVDTHAPLPPDHKVMFHCRAFHVLLYVMFMHTYLVFFYCAVFSSVIIISIIN
jgi:hypothetical protein